MINDNEVLYLIEGSDMDAIKCIYEKYKPIIKNTARQYYYSLGNSVLGIEDLEQNGYIALQYAINNFNSNKNVLFYTYAIKCIKNSIRRSAILSNKKYCKNSAFFNSLEDEKNYYNEYCLLDDIDFSIIDFKKVYYDIEFFDSLVIILKVNGFSYKEISHLLGIKIKKVDYILQKCKNKLKKSFLT